MKLTRIAFIFNLFLLKSTFLFSSNYFINNDFLISVYDDSSSQYNLEQVKKILKDSPGHFIPSGQFRNIFNSDHTYWIYLQRIHPNNKQEYILTFSTWASYMQVYPYPFTTLSCYGGRLVPYSLKRESGCNVILDPGANSYLLKLQTRVHYSVASVKNIQIQPIHTFLHHEEMLDFLQGLIQGMFWLMLSYNLILYAVIRKKVHLFYAVYIFFNSMYLLYVFNYSEIYLFPTNYKLNLLLYTFQPISLFFYVMFIRLMMFNHCSTYTHACDRKTLYPYSILLLVTSLIIAGSIFYKIDIQLISSSISNTISCIVGLILFIVYYKKSDNILHIIMAGSFIMIVFSSLSILYGPIDWFFENISFEIGLLAELILLTYAINKQYSNHIEKRYKAELARKELEIQLGNKNRELVYLAMQLSAKDEAILSIKEKIKNLKLSRDVNSPIFNEIKANDSANRNLWKEFEIHFNETYPGFYTSLLGSFPQLTQNEIKLCAFLKLNLSTKEISMITQKTAHSIEVMRSRIRQKMQLERDENLVIILSQL